MKKNYITAIALKNAISKALSETKVKKINCGNNLYVRVNPTSSICTYIGRIYANSKDTTVTIGRYHDISLSKAREILSDLVKDKENKKSEPTTPLIDDFIWEWYGEKIKTYKAGSSRPKNLRSLIKIILNTLAGIRLDEINAKIVCTNFSAMNQTANNKHNAINILQMCLQNAYLKGIIPFNPLTDILKGSESPFKRATSNGFKWVDATEIKEKYFIPLSSTSLTNRVFYLLIMLTGFRFGETRLLKWSYIDFDKKLIVIPADAQGANKTRVDYYKPMSIQIERLLLNWHKITSKSTGDFIFESSPNKAICEGSFREPFKALTTNELDFHGIRKVIRTWLTSKGVEVNIAELTLQHDVRSKLEKTYNKYSFTEEVRLALQMWGDYVASQLPPEFLSLIKVKEESK